MVGFTGTQSAGGQNRGSRRPPEALTDDQIADLLGACSRRGAAGVRTAALVALLGYSGIRIAEALDLTPADVDLDARTVRVASGKGARTRIVRLGPSSVPWIERWLTKRSSLGVPRSIGGEATPLFCGISKGSLGRPVAPQVVRDALKRLGRKAWGNGHEFDSRLHPHALRHAAAVRLWRGNYALDKIQTQLGHSSLETTKRYLASITPNERLADVDAGLG